jgi:hypothetical protein
MENTSGSFEESISVEGLIDRHLHNLYGKLSRLRTGDEIEPDLKRLTELLGSLKRADQKLERLLDGHEVAREQALQDLKALGLEVTDDRAQLQQLHARVHQMSERTALLISMAQQTLSEKGRAATGAEVHALREQIASLDWWIEERSQELGKQLEELSQRTRHLLRKDLPESEVAPGLEKSKAVRIELDSVNELRQIRELKAALLRKLTGEWTLFLLGLLNGAGRQRIKIEQ